MAALVATGVVAGLLGAPSGASADTKSRAVVVGIDEVGDWGANVFEQGAPLGDLLAQDLVQASIEMGDASTVHFVLKLNSLPPSGGVPEFTRYVWDISVDGKLFILDGKFSNYSRGACDPISEQCPPPRDPGIGPFIIHDRCGASPLGTACREVALVNARFDPSSSTITIPVPLDLLGAEAGSRIEAGRGPFYGTFGYSITAAPVVWRTCSPVAPAAAGCSRTWPVDGLKVTRSFTVPPRL